MTMRKKVLSVVMAFIMLISCLTVAASAYTYNPANKTGEVVISTVADKTTVKRGDVVTFDVHIDPGSKTNLAGSGTVIAFNADQLTPVGSTIPEFRTYVGEHAATYANQNSTAGNMNFNVASLKTFTDEEKALFTRAIQFVGGSTSAANRWNPVPGESYVQFQMTVSDSVNPGDEIWIGVPEAAYAAGSANISYYGDSTRVTRTALTEFNLTNSMIKLTVAGETPAGPVVSKNAAQVKMTLNDEKTAPVISAANPFSLRVISEISEEDWNSYFEPTVVDGKVTTNIKRVGIVGYKGDGTFDMATAVEVAKGADVADYQAADTTYIQKKDGESAKFGARIDFKAQGNIKDVTYVAFVEYGNGEYAFYAEPATAKLLTSYETIVNSYIGFVNK